MKRILIGMVLCGMLTFAGSSWATIMVGSTDVGSLDTLVLNGSTTLANSGDATELAWINQTLLADSLISTPFTLADYSKITGSGGSSWDTTNQSGVFAFALADDPAYFLIKTGNGLGTNSDFLFANNVSLDWAVIYLGDLGFSDIQNVTGISHISEVGGGTTQVPEPGMLLMFGSCLVGLGFFGRKKFRK
jgi:hypothetical protein